MFPEIISKYCDKCSYFVFHLPTSCDANLAACHNHNSDQFVSGGAKVNLLCILAHLVVLLKDNHAIINVVLRCLCKNIHRSPWTLLARAV